MQNRDSLPDITEISLGKIDANNLDEFEIAEKIEEYLDSDKLPKDLARYKHWQKVLDDFANDKSDKQLLSNTLDEIEELIRARKKPRLSIKLLFKNKSEEELLTINEAIETGNSAIYNALLSSVSDPQEFRGNGSVGEVYNIKSIQDFCIKKVHNHDLYNEINFQGKRVQNHIEDEAAFLEELEEFEIDGVRTPAPLFVVSTPEFIGLAMETIDGSNMARVLEKQDKLPASFDFDDYFNRLENYLNALHDRGILHKDIAARNFMITKDGIPAMIDFGRSKREKDFVATNKSFEDEERNEKEAFRKVRGEIKKKMLKQSLIQ